MSPRRLPSCKWGRAVLWEGGLPRGVGEAQDWGTLPQMVGRGSVARVASAQEVNVVASQAWVVHGRPSCWSHWESSSVSGMEGAMNTRLLSALSKERQPILPAVPVLSPALVHSVRPQAALGGVVAGLLPVFWILQDTARSIIRSRATDWGYQVT